jgi:large subunit ribosomal protein L27Ae
MRHFHLKKNVDFSTSINVDKLWHLATKVGGKDIVEKAKAAAGKALVLNVTDAGFFKVLGKGLMPKIPIIVKARYVSRRNR